jgi:GAF domain-containing protein
MAANSAAVMPANSFPPLEPEGGSTHTPPARRKPDRVLLVDTEDLAAEVRWPKFSPVAVERGLRAVLASPIPYNHQAIGVVVVFSATVHPWSSEGELALVAFTDLAALTIANTLQSEERGELATQLQRALDARVVIEQAKGALVAQEGLSEREAFERLRRQARSQRRRVVEVAAEILAAIRDRA